MTPEEMAIRIEVLEKRLARLAGALVVLVESIDHGTAKETARETWEVLQNDMDPPQYQKENPPRGRVLCNAVRFSGSAFPAQETESE